MRARLLATMFAISGCLDKVDVAALQPKTTTAGGTTTTDTTTTSTSTTGAMVALVVSPDSALQLTEGGTGQIFAVTLSAAPSGPVTIAVASSNTTSLGVSPATLLFDPSNFDQPQTVTATALQDANFINENATIDLTGTEVSPHSLSVQITDDDVQSLIASASTLSVNEGMTGTFTVQLAFDPGAPVTVTVASSNPAAATVSPQSLTFNSANFSTPQTVTVTGVQDLNLVNDSATVTLSSSGLADTTVAVTAIDNDVQRIVANPTSVTTSENASTTFTVALAFQPPAATTVSVASSNLAAATVSPASLSFDASNWSTPQTVTVNGIKDANTVNDTSNLTLSSAGLTSVTVAATVIDLDVLNLMVAPTSLTLTEGGATGSFGVSLTQQPAANVSVTVASSNTAAATVSPTTLTFTTANWATTQNVTVTPIKDNDTVDSLASVSLTATGITTQNVAVTVHDTDVQAIVASAASVPVTEGMTSTFTVRLAFNPLQNAAVSIASSIPSSASVSPASLTFTAANYATPQTVTITGVADANTVSEMVTLTLTSTGITSATVNVPVTDTTPTVTCDAAKPLPSPSDGHHNPGTSCIAGGCHASSQVSFGPFKIAGTLYNAVSGGTAVKQATIHIIDANNVDYPIVTANNGNFWSDNTSIVFPVHVRASLCPSADQPMSSTVASSGGSCNSSSCHNSTFRIHLP